MATSLSFHPFHSNRPHPVLDRAAAAWQRLSREIRIRRDLNRLGAFDDAALSDLGLSRGGIEGAIRDGRPGH
jgi:uncharacterized protein YjiS (DUF1127 family)